MKLMRWTSRVVAAGGAVVLATTLAGCHVPQQWHSEVLFDDARDPVFSPDGTKIAFETFAARTPIDTNDRRDVYVYDVASETTELLSVNGAGSNGGNHDSFAPVFSPDGTKVAFSSYASDLGPTDTNNATEVTQDVYLRDLATGETSLVSVNAAGNDSGRGTSFAPVFTPDGRGIAFTSRAPDLTSTRDGNNDYDLFLRRLRAGRTKLVSVNATGTASAQGASSGPTFTDDGSKVAFTSTAGDLGPTDGNAVDDVYLRDLRTGATTLVSVNAAGTSGGNGFSSNPLLVGDGSRIVFSSHADDHGPTDTNGARDVYMRDLRAGTTELVSVNATGTDSADHLSTDPVLSPDGRLVAFNTTATNLGPPDSGEGFDWDVYVRDLRAGTTKLVSVNAAGTDGGNDFSGTPVFSPDGKTLAFTSEANDLGPTDTNVCVLRLTPFPCSDVYVRKLDTWEVSVASSDGEDSLDNRHSRDAVFNPVDSNELAFDSLSVSTSGGGEAIHLATP